MKYLITSQWDATDILYLVRGYFTAMVSGNATIGNKIRLFKCLSPKYNAYNLPPKYDGTLPTDINKDWSYIGEYTTNVEGEINTSQYFPSTGYIHAVCSLYDSDFTVFICQERVGKPWRI